MESPPVHFRLDCRSGEQFADFVGLVVGEGYLEVQGLSRYCPCHQ